MKKRIRKRGGFTVAEALIATAILALFVSMAIVGTSALFGTGEDMMAVAKAAVLGSDVMKAVTNELRFGESFSCGDKDNPSGTTIAYDSTTYGEGCTMTIDGNGQLFITSAHEKEFYPISDSSYDEVKVESISFSIKTLTEVTDKSEKRTRQVISCTLSISDGTDSLWEKTVSIVPIAQKTDPFKAK